MTIERNDTEPAPAIEARPEDVPPPETPRADMRDEVSLAMVYAVAVDCASSMERTRQDLLGSNGALERLRRELSLDMAKLREQLTPPILRIGDMAAIEPLTPAVRVLVVDDMDLTLRAMERVLTMHKIEVLKAHDGAEALALLRTERVDVLLTDLEMPGNGSTLCKHICEEHPEVIMVLMTGHETRTASRKALELGAFAFILKPFEPDELVLTMNSAAAFARSRLATMQALKGKTE